ncbi:MAG: thioredoxin family protein [Actinomycetes bacterium]
MDNGQLIVVFVLLVGTVFGLNRLRTDGKVNLHRPGSYVTQAELGHPMGNRATFIQFSSPYCQPCKTTHSIVQDLAQSSPQVAHVDLQVADHLDLVNQLHIMRTPTTVLLDSRGHVVSRIEGIPRIDELHDALVKILDTQGQA